MREKLCIEETIGPIHHSAFSIQHYTRRGAAF